MTSPRPHLAHIWIYPIKSLDGISTCGAKITSGGSLQHDRQFAIVDRSGKFVNAKRTAQVHRLEAQFDLVTGTVCIGVRDRDPQVTFSLFTDQTQGIDGVETGIERDRFAIAHWLSAYFDFPVELIENQHIGFPDDTNSPGPTIISTATLEAVNTWFPELSLNELRQRFRANLEISGVPAFWEDRLFAEAGKAVKFQVGDVQFLGINPCQRCIVPTRHAQTGEAYANFQKIFTLNRQANLPDWANLSRFNHFYRLSVNTRIPSSESDKIIQVGNEVKVTPIEPT